MAGPKISLESHWRVSEPWDWHSFWPQPSQHWFIISQGIDNSMLLLRVGVMEALWYLGLQNVATIHTTRNSEIFSYPLSGVLRVGVLNGHLVLLIFLISCHNYKDVKKIVAELASWRTDGQDGWAVVGLPTPVLYWRIYTLLTNGSNLLLCVYIPYDGGWSFSCLLNYFGKGNDYLQEAYYLVEENSNSWLEWSKFRRTSL